MRQSLIYSQIHLYRLAMNLLYRGRYRQRFVDIVELIGPRVRSVCDLCFGDIFIAEWCRARGIRWIGIDLNRRFCERARRRGFEVIEGDLFAVKLPDADVFVIAGSLYHFHARLSLLFDNILRHTNRFILSEPIQNLSSQGGVLGWWAQRSADPGSGHAVFRYNEQSLLAGLREQQRRKGFQYRIVSIDRDILLEINR
jgi:hypothetical protein